MVGLAFGADHVGDPYEQAQRDLRRLFEDLVGRGQHTADLDLRFRVRTGQEPGVSLVRVSTRDTVLYDVFTALQEVGPDRIRACPECGQIFVKVTRKEYCSTRCQSRVYMRQMRAAERAARQKGSRHGKTRPR
jgi:hypothetical protein